MKKLTKFLTVFLLALLGANLQPAWATTYTFYYQKDMPSNWWEANQNQTMTQSSAYNKRYYCTISLDANSSYGIYVKEDNTFYKNNTTAESNQKVQLYKYDQNNSNRVTFKSGNSGTYIFTYDADTKELFVSPQSSQTIVMYYVNTGGNTTYDSYYCLDNSLSLTQEGTSAQYSGIVNLTSAQKHYMYVKIGSDLYWRGKTTLSVGSSTQLYFYKKGGTCGDSGDKINFTPSSSGKYKFTWNHLDKTMKMERVYTITYNLNGGSGADTPSAQDVVSGNNVTLADKPSGLTKTGYDFVGWNTKADGTGANTYNPGATIGPIQTNYTMYAKWTPQVYTITYKDQDGADFTGENLSSLPSTHTYGTATTLVNATRAGYRFDGWFESSDCTSSAVTTIGATAKTDNFTLYAKWTEDKVYYDVTSGVKSFAGSVEQSAKATLSIIATSGEYNSSTNKVLASSVLQFDVSNIATGYEIEGWYSDAACSSKIDGAGTDASYTAPAATGNIIVYVKIIATTYNIIYEATYGVAHSNSATYNVEDAITFSAPSGTRTGYTFTAWSPASITKGTTGAQTVTAQWQAKTYTVSFSQEGGTGGQTATVTATYDQPMPETVTCPTRVGYKFKGYYDATSGGKKYYNANGTSANNWDIDQENPTLYAQWTQMHVYVQGRMHVANKKRSEGGEITWTNTFADNDDDQWDEASRRIEMTWDDENKYYKLVTNATLSDLSSMFGNDHNLPQYFYLRSTSVTASSGAWDGSTYKQVENGNAFTLADKGEEKAREWASNGTHQPCFSSDDRSGYVIIYFNETQLWYELDEFTTYDVEFSNGGGGGTVTPSGTKKTGEVSWEVTVSPNEGYSFAGWTLTGGAKAKEDDEQLKTYYTIHVTATGAGKAIANFKIKPKLYFQTNSAFSNNGKVYAYFYKNEYFDKDGGTGSKKDWGCISGPHEMQPLGHDNIYYMYYDVEYLRSQGMDSHIAFTKDSKNDAERFFQTNVVYRGDFYPCDKPLFVVTDYDKTYNESGYYNGYWSTMVGDEPEDYLMMQSENWKTNENMRFKKDNNGNWTVIKTYAGSGNAYKDLFKVWRNCDGNWYGYGQSKDGEMSITSDTRNAKIYAGNHNVEIIPWKAGEYEFTWNPNAKEISVIYLGDITVANFPGEVSTFVNRQHKVQPDVTLRNGTSVTDVAIKVAGHDLPWTSSYATYEQNGTNLVITGNAIGSETVTVRYQNTKQEPYIVDRTLKVNVATPIVIQAKLKKEEDGETDDYWSNTGLVHIHFWGAQEGTAQDLPMSYNKDTKVFSVTAPKIDGFKFMFWYGEDINQSATEQWRKTIDIVDCSKSTCYSILYGKDNNTKRGISAKTDLCSADEYYVEITMKNGNTYKSNTIDNLDKKVSFFAPKDNDETTYMRGSVRVVHNGAVSNVITGFDAAGVYVAKINSTADGFESKSLYTGNYYIRTDGAHGAWGDYKTDADNLMTSFTPRAEKGETYSYYWVKNVAKNDDNNDGKTNVKADVANDYNDNLAGMIENDKFTDGGGFVYNSTNGANVRFSYEPTTNEFKRAILGGAGNNNFLNVYSKTNNLYADNEYSKQLSESADLNDSKFSDLSDWVYEKRVYVRADGANASKAILKSVFNGQTTHLLGYQINSETGEETDVPNELEVMGSQSRGDFALRITYDFKKNRLIASWEPGQREIFEDMIIDSDVLFVQQEAADGTIDDTDVAQITYTQGGIDADAKLTSLKNMIYVLEVTDKVIDNTDAENQLYWICLPFDCRISDIFGVEGYVKLDAGGRAISGTWGIQRYDGTTRAAHGWFEDDNPEGFWKWMTRDEILKAGTGYVVVFDKTGASSWPSIDVEVACNSGTDCVEGKKTVKKRSKRLYFPSIGSKFEICYSGSSANVVKYADEPCNVTKPYDRSKYDGNWKVIGPVSYNNIGVDQDATSNLTYYYTYSQDKALAGSAHYTKYAVGPGTEMKSFHGYMTQFGGNLTWKPFTKSDDVTGKAPLYAVAESEFKGGMLTIELNNAQGAELDRTFVNLHKNGTLGFDQNMELTQITENCAQIASVNEDVLYAGSTLPLDIELVPLNVKVTANGTYDIALKQSLEGLEVKLFDAFEQTITPLDLMSATVTLEKGEYKDRFFLQFKQKGSDTPTSFDGKLEQYNLPMDKTQKLLFNGNIYLINAGRVYNATGAELR